MGGTDALQWMVDLLYTHKAADPASLESTEDDVRKALETGKYALTYNWEGTLPEANDPSKSQAAPNIKIALLPGSKDVKSSSVNGSEGWAILAGSKNQDAAWKLLEYMVSPAWQKKAALIAGDYPVLSSLYSDPDLQKNVAGFPDLRRAVQVPGRAPAGSRLHAEVRHHPALSARGAAAEDDAQGGDGCSRGRGEQGRQRRRDSADRRDARRCAPESATR